MPNIKSFEQYPSSSGRTGAAEDAGVLAGGGDFFSTHGVGQNRSTATFSSPVSGSTYAAAPAAPSVDRPEPYTPATFNAPTYNEREVAAETQRLQAPSLRRLRQALQQVQTQRFDNPNVRRMTLREALAGYGAGLESAYTGARREARASVNEKYQREYEAAKINFEAQNRAAELAYQQAWNEYLNSIPQRSTQTSRTNPVTGSTRVTTVSGRY